MKTNVCPTCRWVLSFVVSLSVWTLGACDSVNTDTKAVIGSGSGGGNGDRDPNPGQGLAKRFNPDEITKRRYWFKEDLSFAAADSQRETRLTGTPQQHEVLVYFYVYKNQQRVPAAAVATTDTFCSLVTDTDLSTRGDQIQFSGMRVLRNGQLTQQSNSKDFSFGLILQQSVTQNVQLFCKNIIDVEGIRRHVGHLLEIVNL